jgi:hypothetical protein
VFSSLLSLSELFSLQLFSALHSTQLMSTQLFSALLRSSHVRSSHLITSHHITSHLISSHLSLSIQLLSSQLMSAHLMSSQLLSSLSDHLNSSLAQNLLQNRISAPKPEQVRCWSLFENGKRQKQEKSSKTSRHNFGASISIRFARNKLQKTMKLEQQLRNHPNAICKQGVAKDHRTTCPIQFANSELQKTIELCRAPATQSNCYAATPMHFASAR